MFQHDWRLDCYPRIHANYSEKPFNDHAMNILQSASYRKMKKKLPRSLCRLVAIAIQMNEFFQRLMSSRVVLEERIGSRCTDPVACRASYLAYISLYRFLPRLSPLQSVENRQLSATLAPGFSPPHDGTLIGISGNHQPNILYKRNAINVRVGIGSVEYWWKYLHARVFEIIVFFFVEYRST